MPSSPKEISSEQASKMIDCVSLRNREQVRARLAQLVRSQDYQIVNTAMCYSPMPMPERIDYICPKCGARTAYNRDKARYIQNMPDMRKQIRGLNLLCSTIKSEFKFTLDESPLCARCGKVKPAGYAVLITAEGKSKPVRGVLRGSYDIELVISFFEGRQFWGDTQLRDEVKKSRISSDGNIPRKGKL